VNNLLDLGIKQHQAGQLVQAEQIYRRVLQSEPNNADAHHLLGVIAHQVGQHEQAIQLIERAIKLNPNYADYYSNLANVYRALAKYSTAIELYQQAIKINAKHIQAWGNLGNVHKELEQYEQAIRCYQKVTRYLPNNPIAYNNIGVAYKALKNYAQAESYYKQAIKIQPHYADAQHNLSVVLCLQNKFTQALKHGKLALKYNAKLWPAYVNLAEIYQQQQQSQAALDILLQVINQGADYAPAYFTIGKLMYERDQYDDALRAYNEVLRLEPQHAEALSNAGSIYKERGQYQQARQYFTQALEIKPNQADMRNNLASTLMELGLLHEAYHHYQLALMQDPHNIKIYNNISILLRTQGKVDAAIEYCDRGLNLEPESADLHLSKAMTALIAGRFAVGWKEYIWRYNRLNNSLLPVLSPIIPLPTVLTQKTVLLHRDQGIGDELFFLRFAPELKQRGAKIIYHSSDKLAPLLHEQAWLDELITPKQAHPAADYSIMLGDLPFMLAMQQVAQIPPPIKLSVKPELQAQVYQQLTALGPPPYIGVTWQAGARIEQRGKLKVLSKHIDTAILAQCLAPIKATILVLQRQPDAAELIKFNQQLGVTAHDCSDFNQDLNKMLALLACLDEYVSVSNTNIHLIVGLNKTARVLMPSPAEWRWMLHTDESPWFAGCKIYRQKSDLDWIPAIASLQRDLSRKYGSLWLQTLDFASLINRATQCRNKGDVLQAEACYRQALLLQPNNIEVWGELGNLMDEQEHYTDAIESYQAILALHPQQFAALNNLAAIYVDIGDFEQAIRLYQQLIELKPDLAAAYTNLGMIYKELGQLDTAIKYYQQSINYNPNYAETYNNLALIYVRLKDWQTALAYYDQALAVQPDYHNAQFGKAYIRFLLAEFTQRAWREYLFRPARINANNLSSINILPQNLHQRTILIRREQGLGDELFFLRFLPLLKQRGGKILYQAGSKLSTILQRCPYIDEILPQNLELQAIKADFTILVADLPLLLGIDHASQLPPPLTLKPFPEQVTHLRTILQQCGPPPYIGITWQAGTYQAGRTRKLFKHIDVALLAQTLKPIKATYILLQRNADSEQVAEFKHYLQQDVHDMDFYHDDLEGMLALLSLLDTYVGVSNTNVHLLAGLGQQAQILIPYPPEWRWLAQGTSPWFKQFSVYRQAEDGCWDKALAELTQSLKTKFI
jgi:tetratricopeptide (TPR) repeat protein